MKTKAALLAALAALAANAVQMATENWVSNRLTEATAPIRESVAALISATQTLQSAVGSLAGNVYTKQETDDRIVELAPTTSLEPATNYTDRATNDVLQSSLRADAAALSAFASTGAVARASVYGTPTRWTDATGCVWEAVHEHFTEWEYSGVPSGYVFSMYFDGAFPGYSWSLERNGGGEYYSDIFYTDEDEEGATETSLIIPTPLADVTCTREWIGAGTNLVGRVALTNDIPDVSGYTTPADVTAAIREQSLGGIWDEALQVWWTPRMRNGSLTYEATTNVNLNAEN